MTDGRRGGAFLHGQVARDGERREGRQHEQPDSNRGASEQQLADAEQSGVNQHAAKDRVEQLAAQ